MAYWVLLIPSLLINVMEKFAGEPFKNFRNERLEFLNVVLGILVFGLVVAMASGIDLSATIRSLF